MRLKSKYVAALALLAVFTVAADETAAPDNHLAIRERSKRDATALQIGYEAFADQQTRNRAENRNSQGDRISENARGALPVLTQDSVHAIADLANEKIGSLPRSQCGVLRIAFREPTRPDVDGEGVVIWFDQGPNMGGGEDSMHQSGEHEAEQASLLAASLGVQKQVKTYNELVTTQAPLVGTIVPSPCN